MSTEELLGEEHCISSVFWQKIKMLPAYISDSAKYPNIKMAK